MLKARNPLSLRVVTLLDKPWDNQCYDAYESMIKHIKTKDGKWKFDYSIFDEYVEFGRSYGLGPVISCYTMCPWEYMVTWEDEDGAIHKVKAIPGTPEFKEYWRKHDDTFCEQANGGRLMVGDRNHSHPHSGSS